MKITSNERSTGQGAAHWIGVWDADEGKYYPVSAWNGRARYEGRFNGFERFAMDVPADTAVCVRYRSNGGNERVATTEARHLTDYADVLSAFAIIDGMEKSGVPCRIFMTLEAANDWAAKEAEREVSAA